MKSAQLFAKLRVAPDGAHHMLLREGKPLLTPADRPYRLPTRALAEAVAAEWRAQTEKIVPATMPLTGLAATAIDIVAGDRTRIADQLTAYAASELLCHRAGSPAALAAKQDELWQPLLDWCAARFGALLAVGEGVMPIAQSPEAIAALHGVLAAHDDFPLAGLSFAAETTGSLVLALALAEGQIDAAGVFKAAELDAHFQAEAWGEDPAAAARHASIRRDLENAERWFALLATQ